MKTEKIITVKSGYGMLVFTGMLLLAAIAILSIKKTPIGIIPIVGILFILPGFYINNPNEAKALTLFGNYVGTVSQNGLLWSNPFYLKRNISLRARNFNGQNLKVNDKIGNPIEIAAVLVWQVTDTYKALFDVDDYSRYVAIQSEAAVRHLAGTCPYDNLEDDKAQITLRDGGDKVCEMLEKELNERLGPAGIKIMEARISHLAYAPEIAHAMLQRQQAAAVVAARKLIVEGAVGMVEMAIAKLSEKQVVHLDEERKAAMVSNMLVVLCGDKNVNPVINTGTLYN